MKRAVAVKPVRLLAGAFTAEVVGLVTTANPVSAMSERLANKLHIKKMKPITVKNSQYIVPGFLPEQAVNVTASVKLQAVECAVSRESIGEDKVTVPVAFIILPSPFDELVLGRDWIIAAGQKLGGSVVVSSSENTRNDNHLHIGIGQPTPGPGFVEDIDSAGHMLVVNEKDYAALLEMEKSATGSASST